MVLRNTSTSSLYGETALASTFERQHRYLEFMVKSGDLIGQSLDWHETLKNVCAAAVQTVADICLLDLWQNGVLNQVAATHRNPDKNSKLETLAQFARERGPHGLHPTVEVAKGERPMLVEHIDDTWIEAHATSAEMARALREFEYRSMMIVPVLSRSYGVLGALTLIRTNESNETYDSLSLDFARDLGRRCGTAISKAMLHSQVVDVAMRYQRAALPSKLPKSPVVSFDAFYEPSSEEMLVGGDWYDAFELSDGQFGITIGDVMGHGVDAAVAMSALRNGLRAALLSTHDPHASLSIGDSLLRNSSHDGFATALTATLDPATCEFRCASAGHPGPLVSDARGVTRDPFTYRELPLGLGELYRREAHDVVVRLEQGTFVALFSDGLIEWNRNIDESLRKLYEAISDLELRKHANPAHELFARMGKGTPHADDIAILTVLIS